MHKQVQNIINRTNKPKKDVLNILTFNTHERYQSQLAKTGHNFYAFMHEGAKEWFPGHGQRPDNYYVLPKNTVPNIDFDLILSQSKFGQYQIASQINNVLRLPIVSLEHTLPIPSWPKAQLDAMRNMVGDVNVFISDYSAKEWNISAPYVVIKHSIDSEKYRPDDSIVRLPQVLSVVHDFINRDYCCNYSGWKRITNGIKTKVIGDTPGLSKQSASEAELVKEYQMSQIFLNTSTISPIPTALLEAMSCGCAVVTTATCMIPEIIENGKNGFLSNNESELRSYLDLLLLDKDLREELGNNARQTILEKFSESSFINNWNQVFEHAYGVL